MSNELKYHCSKCSNEFTISEAVTTDGIIQLSAAGAQMIIPINVAMINIVCPKCNTIASSFATPKN
jgi:DNA-directed RNA polymerase subunit RPC12/RpoP